MTRIGTYRGPIKSRERQREKEIHHGDSDIERKREVRDKVKQRDRGTKQR